MATPITKEDVKVREVGSLVTYWVSRTLKTHTGMIVEVLPEDRWIMDYTIPVYRVMCGLGHIEQYTEAALRDFAAIEEKKC